MRLIGALTTVVAGAAAVFVAAMSVRSIPDIRRYFRIRQM
jgi:hypothetical protein